MKLCELTQIIRFSSADELAEYLTKPQNTFFSELKDIGREKAIKS